MTAHNESEKCEVSTSSLDPASAQIPGKPRTAQIPRGLRHYADLLIALCGVIAVSTYLSVDPGYGGFFIVLALVLSSLGYFAGTAVAAMTWAARRRWGRAAANATKRAVFFLAWRPLLGAGDYVHLALYYPVYRQQIDARPPGRDAQARFFWGDKALWVTDGLQADTLVYDPTDVLSKSIGKVQDASEPGLGLATRHLIGHFYIEREFSR